MRASFLRSAVWLVPVLLAGCSGKGTTANTGGSSSGTASTNATGTGATGTNATTGAGMSGIPGPGPGANVDNEFANVEPNNTPQQATPLGTSALNGINVWVTNNMTSTTDATDYFVFQSSPMGGPFTFNICFNAPVTSMTATLWKVVGGVAQTPPLMTWNSSATCVTNMGSAVTMTASTEYLFGLTSSGGAGTYSA